ncbi:hypothetical protein ACHMW5_08540 (plasmid) [Azospirillum melinis]|uniref:hypothetical protein n=1 Tax=Azospirillum melinis TaxID=328839 RepID=UPI003756733B
MSTQLEIASRLIDCRRYLEALDILESPPFHPSSDWLVQHRRCLARMLRFAEAAEVGRRVLAGDDVPAVEWFRQSQILVRAGLLQEAVQAAGQALVRSPQAAFLPPLIEALLRDPRLMQMAGPLLEALAEQRVETPAGTELHDGGMQGDASVHVPMRLPYYAPLCADHPFVMGWVHQTSSPRFLIGQGPADFRGLSDALNFARKHFIKLLHLHPTVTVEYAAAYVSSRFESLLYHSPGSLIDFMSMAVMSLGQRPYVLAFDYIPSLFHPFFAYEDMAVDRKSPFYWIVREFLENSACLAIITTYASSGDMLERYFSSQHIRKKCVFINPCFSIDESMNEREREDVAERETNTLLFTSSRHATGENFYARGGVDVLNTFEYLASSFPDLRLILRSPLPATLSSRLRQLVETHPRIEHYPDPLPWPAFRRLFQRASIFALPGVTAYRNGLVQAMGWGVVPLVSDGAHMADLVEDGVTGTIVPGRAALSRFDEASGCMIQRWACLLQETDAPADPVFAARYRDALRGLLEDPNRLAQLRQANMSRPNLNRMTTDDLIRFQSTISAALDQARCRKISG